MPGATNKLLSAQEFCEYVAENLTGIKSPSELFQVLNENGEWNTWARWSVWCNGVVRAHIEGKSFIEFFESTMPVGHSEIF
jgi:hypothetical protein